MKIEHRARTEHTLNKASATLFCRYSKRVLQVGNQSSWLKIKVCSVRGLIANPDTRV
ncbi:hypothetical protein HanHA300_Chr16g0630211 [Helianthus annuus]|nr:hypothetical protein HanHA300_Chr16g0630211 [Helianthus annuus]KAJ0445090.1 hypothetical protein HanIR_Chr16g0839101 [Helianthus annuus]KAJ0462254.1 hypothetical protein HanHA89_Chr16g0681421 [Helianthus annuus]KAJ0642675.1 hypothetical protein HanLR1_Chr16g0640991 [Helianthus annuus]KAJ0646521.1 hypothetical protein HanOQP8_Chr16g0636141 [Helianthus annuus]